MRYLLFCSTITFLFLCSCSNVDCPYSSESEVDYEGLCLYDSLSGGYISWVIETAVDNHISNYLGFEKEQRFFDSLFLSNYPESVENFFVANEDGFSFTLDVEKTTIIVYFHGVSFLEMDVSQYDCHHLSCLYPHRVLLYDKEGHVLINEELASAVKHGLRIVEYAFLKKGYSCDTVLDVDIPFQKSLFCDVSSFKEPVFRCFFDTIAMPQNDYMATVVDRLDYYCKQYGLSRIVSSFVILSPHTHTKKVLVEN